MIYFRSDYSQGAHPRVLEALERTNLEHTDGYGHDRHCSHVESMIRGLTGQRDCQVHMMVGGTACNITVIATSLRPYECVVAAKSGHIYVHETGGVEATGHRIMAMDGGADGKLTPALIDRAWEEYQDEHTLLPRLVYISQPTETGALYTKAEMEALSLKCREQDMFLYLDGARLASALVCRKNDLSLEDLAKLCNAFYLGGTKNGALFGEALVINTHLMNDHIRFMMKRQGGLLAKGRLIGVQFEALLEGGKNSVYFQMAAHANEMADKLREGLAALGVSFYSDSPTNQLFPILPARVVWKLAEEFAFYEWGPQRDGMIPIRLVTGWGTEETEVEAFLHAVEPLLKEESAASRSPFSGGQQKAVETLRDMRRQLSSWGKKILGE